MSFLASPRLWAWPIPLFSVSSLLSFSFPCSSASDKVPAANSLSGLNI